MKRILFSLALVCSIHQVTIAQFSGLSTARENTGTGTFTYGIRAGLNISHITNNAALATRNSLGLVAGIFADKSVGKTFGMREEISYIRSGFKFKNPGTEGSVNLQYFYLTHLFTFNLGRIIQLHLGPQAGVLINAVGDSINHLNESNTASFFSISNKTNRFAVGGCAGLEVYPYKGLLIGVRYNLSFTAVNKKDSYNSMAYLTNNAGAASKSSVRFKNEMWQIVLGWRLGIN